MSSELSKHYHCECCGKELPEPDDCGLCWTCEAWQCLD